MIRMINHQQVKRFGQFLHRIVRKFLEAALLPRNFDLRVGFGKAPGGGQQGQQAARMVSGDASKPYRISRGHELSLLLFLQAEPTARQSPCRNWRETGNSEFAG